MSEEDKPEILVLTIPETNATAEIELLWDVAPKTCEAIVKQLPLESICVHGRNSGDEALMPLPVLLKGIPQDSTENSTTEYKKGYVVFGYEAVGSGYGGIDNSQDACEIAWMYGDAVEASYWVSVHGPPHDKPPYVRKVAETNLFAKVINEDNFYTTSSKLQRTGQLKITLSVKK